MRHGRWQHRGNRRDHRRWCYSAGIPTDIPGRTEKADIVGPDQRRIADAWSGKPESRRQIKTSLAGAGMNTPTLPVSRSHRGARLALSIEKQEAPPFGLLQVAETIGGADWEPARMAFGEALAGLIAEVPKTMCEPAALASVLRKSNELAELEAVALSRFGDPQVAQAVERAHGRDRAKLELSIAERHCATS